MTTVCTVTNPDTSHVVTLLVDKAGYWKSESGFRTRRIGAMAARALIDDMDSGCNEGVYKLVMIDDEQVDLLRKTVELPK